MILISLGTNLSSRFTRSEKRLLKEKKEKREEFLVTVVLLFLIFSFFLAGFVLQFINHLTGDAARVPISSPW